MKRNPQEIRSEKLMLVIPRRDLHAVFRDAREQLGGLQGCIAVDFAERAVLGRRSVHDELGPMYLYIVILDCQQREMQMLDFRVD